MVGAWQEAELAESSAVHFTHDPWEELVAAWVTRHSEPFTTAEVLSQALERKPTHVTRGEENRVGAILRTLGYEKARARRGTRRAYVWARREAVELAAEQGEPTLLPASDEKIEA